MIRNFLAAIGCLTLIVALLVAGWWFRDDLAAWWEARAGVVATEPSLELAEEAEVKVQGLMDGSEDEIRLSELELQSYLQYRVSFPPGVYNPAVDLQDTTAKVSVDLNLAELSRGSQAADGLRRFMGDSTRVNTQVYPRVVEEGRAGLTVMSLQAGVVPVPPLFIPNILSQTGFEVSGGRTVIIPISREIEDIRIADDEVLLKREER